MKTLFVLVSSVTFFIMTSPAQAQHITGAGAERNDPWNNCTECHGVDLNGGSGPSCMSCHNDFVSPDLPTNGHHGGDRFTPLNDCAPCHGADLTGLPFGVDWAPSCYDCHGPLWTPLPPISDPNGPYTVDVSQPVLFDGSGSYDHDGTIVSYYWDFGDGFVGSGVSPIHTYPAPGLYTVNLTVTDDGTLTDSATTTAVITFFDADQDGISDQLDNCLYRYNPSQTDCDQDFIGDTCDQDTQDRDGDGVDNSCDNCPDDLNFTQLDADGDGIGDVCDGTPGCGGCAQAPCETEC